MNNISPKYKKAYLWLGGLLLSLVLCLSASAAQNAVMPHPKSPEYEQMVRDTFEKLFSLSVSEKFYELSYETIRELESNQGRSEVNSKLSSEKIYQAIILLQVTGSLNNKADYVLPEILKLAGSEPQVNRFAMVSQILLSYVDKSSDLEVVESAVRYLMELFDTREGREEILDWLLENLNGRNAAVDSELLTLKGLLAAEVAQYEEAANFFAMAYSRNNYNRLAFEKLSELAPQMIDDMISLERRMLLLDENPLDMQSALSYAEHLRDLQLYDTAAKAYDYCVELFRYRYPFEPLPASIYLPWTISYYNTERGLHKCLQISDELKANGQFDLLVETIAAKTARKTGNKDLSESILKNAELLALRSAKETNTSGMYEKLAWFYCFALPDADNALDWANKAYASDSGSEAAASLLAYALQMNNQYSLAETLLDSYPVNPIFALTGAQIKISQDRKSDAFEILRLVINLNPGSFEAETAKQILLQHGGEYIAPIAPDVLLDKLKEAFGREFVREMLPADQLISVELSAKGSKFSYGSDFDGSVSLTNISHEPLVITDDSLFAGNIRIDANVSGDLNRKIPNLVNLKIRPSESLGAGRSMLVGVNLFSGELRDLLLRHPQASIDIEFTAYIDAVAGVDGEPTNRLGGIRPAKLRIERPGISVTTKYLQNRLNSLSKGKQGQKIATGELFAGLLSEQQAMANREPLYRFVYADWMPAILKSAMIHNLADDNWVVNVHTMYSLMQVELDFDLTSAVADKLNHEKWPTRLMTIYLLAKRQDDNLQAVLDWTAEYDSDPLVRQMAIALGGKIPVVEEETAEPNTPQD